MSGKFIFQLLTSTLANGETLPFQTDARFLRILENSGADFKIQLNEDSETVIKKGLSIKLSGPEENNLTKVSFINDTGAQITIQYSLSNYEVTDDRLNVSGSLVVTLSGNTVTSPAAFAVTDAAQIAVATDLTTKEVTLQNNGANDIWLGDVNVDPAALRGYKLEPGTSIIWSSTAQVYARCGAGLASTLSIVRLRQV